MVKAIPEGYHTVTPYFIVRDGRRAIDFYKRAFGAQELNVMPGPGGKGIMHAELKIGNSIVMFSEENPQQPCRSAETLGASPVNFYLYVPDVDAAFKKAVAAGATAEKPVQDMFWGDRTGSVKDPFGYGWSLATHLQDLTPEQMRQGAEEFMAQMAAR